MNPVVKAQLTEFSTTNPIQGFEEQDYFEVYSIFSILNGDLNHNVSAFDAHLKGKEFGLDGVALLVQGNLCLDTDDVVSHLDKNSLVDFIFFQSKRSEKFDYADISKFIDGVCGFFDGTMSNESEQLDDLIAGKDAIYDSPLRKNPKLRCYYVSTGNYSKVDRIEKLIDLGISRLNSMNLFESVSIELIDAPRTQNAYRLATNSNSAVIEFPKCQTLPEHDSVEEAYMGYISASQILNLVSENSDASLASNKSVVVNQSVFFDNIRDFNPNSEINKSIISEIKNGDTDSFVFKNNGVTVVAKDISRKGDKFTVENFQIVNGCQTSNILFECRDYIDSVKVPLRLIASTDDTFVSSIIIGTNKQNEVKDDQFWALKPFLKDLEEFGKNQEQEEVIFLERRENQYRNSAVERTRIVKPAELMKCVVAMFLYQPNRAARDWRGIRKDFEDKIFLKGHGVEPYHLASLANYKFNFIVRNKRIDRSLKIYQYYSHYALGAIACGNKDLFSLSNQNFNNACIKIREVISNEAKFIEHVLNVERLIKKLIVGRNVETREQLRDTLRSESFDRDFKSLLKKEFNL